MLGCVDMAPQHFYYTHMENYEWCSREIKVYIDSEFGEEDKVEIGKAIDAWNYVLNGAIIIRVEDSRFDVDKRSIDGWVIIRGGVNENGVRWTGTKTALAYADRVGGNRVWLIRERVDSGDIREVMMHEMGHLLGSGHMNDGLMYYQYTRKRYECIGWEVVREVGKWNKIGIERMNYCIK